MVVLLILDFLIYTAIIVILHLILKNYLHNNNTHAVSIKSLQLDSETENVEDDVASWDEVSVQQEVINPNTTAHTEQPEEPYSLQPEQDQSNKEFYMIDRAMFNVQNKHVENITRETLWNQNHTKSELLQNDVSNDLDKQYSTYIQDIKDETIPSQSYDSIVDLRSQEEKTYFDQPSSQSSHSSVVPKKTSLLEQQYNTLKQPVDTESFLRTETVESIRLPKSDNQDNQDNNNQQNEVPLKTNGVYLSDTRNTFPIMNNIQAFENNGTFSTI
tara:strand:+ start:6 stop:821 length:816 start_codon:yes stop_codon:yes gene_type:complete